MWNVINIYFKKWPIISGNALKSHGVVASNTLSLSFCLVAYDGIFLLFLVLLSRLCTREWLGCLSRENVGIYWAFDSSCFLADSCHLNPQVLPKYPSTAAWHTEQECLLLATPPPRNPCTYCSSVRKIRVNSSASRTERLPLSQTFILLLQWDKMHVFKLERVKALP